MRPGVRGEDIGVVMRCLMAAADMTDGDGWRRYLVVLLDGLRHQPAAELSPEATLRAGADTARP